MQTENELESLKHDAASEDAADSFMHPKKKRGRPKGSKSHAKASGGASDVPPGGPSGPRPLGTEPDPRAFQQEVENNKKFVRPMIGAVSSLGVKYAEDERAAMGPTEMEVIVDSASACLAQYLPAVLGAHANAVVLFATLTQWSFRVYMLRMENLEKLKAEYRAKHGNPQGPQQTQKPIEPEIVQ